MPELRFSLTDAEYKALKEIKIATHKTWKGVLLMVLNYKDFIRIF
jgi:hypothetical protein